MVIWQHDRAKHWTLPSPTWFHTTLSASNGLVLLFDKSIRWINRLPIYLLIYVRHSISSSIYFIEINMLRSIIFLCQKFVVSIERKKNDKWTLLLVSLKRLFEFNFQQIESLMRFNLSCFVFIENYIEMWTKQIMRPIHIYNNQANFVLPPKKQQQSPVSNQSKLSCIALFIEQIAQL